MATPSASDDLLEKIDAACDLFEAEWQSGRVPQLQQFLVRFNDSDRGHALERLLAVELEYRGKKQELLTADEYTARFPGLEAFINRAFSLSSSAFASADVQTAPIVPPDPRSAGNIEPHVEVVRIAHLGPYELLEMLGEGGMGAVFRARHKMLNRFVAIKVLTDRLKRSPEAVARFEREMKAVGSLEHPNIVRAMDADEYQGTRYLVMELIEGQDLQKMVKQRGPLGVPEACRIIRDAAMALEYAHRAGLIHRDIKPSNLLITKDGQLKVLDLGLARIVQEQGTDGLTDSGISLGTPDYMAPEQWSDPHSADHQTDLYALGCTLHFLLVGRPPYGTEQYRTIIEKMTAHAQGVIPRLRDTRPDVPPSLDDLHKRLLSKNKEVRPRSAGELADVLQPFCLAGLPSLMPTGKSGRYIRTWTNRTTLIGGTLLLCSVSVVIVALSLITGGEWFTSLTSQPTREPQATWRSDGLLDPSIPISPDLEDPIKPHNHEGIVASEVHRPGPLWTGWPADGPQPAVAPFNAEDAERFQEQWAEHLGVPVRWTNPSGIEFVFIPPGEFVMGLPGHIKTSEHSSHPEHRVAITKGFFLSKYEVTQSQYAAITGSNPGCFAPGGRDSVRVAGEETNNLPVEYVTWAEAVSACKLLSVKEGLLPASQSTEIELRFEVPNCELDNVTLSDGYRLPTEAEWEMACRAGTNTLFNFGNNEHDYPLFAHAYMAGEGKRGAPFPVGNLAANAFGLFDMHGNVCERCLDGVRNEPYPSGLQVDPFERSFRSGFRVYRGGSWGWNPDGLLSGLRHMAKDNHRENGEGFRIAISADVVKSARKRKPQPGSLAADQPSLIRDGGWLETLPLIRVSRDRSKVWWDSEWRIEKGELIHSMNPAATSGHYGELFLPVKIAGNDLEIELAVTPEKNRDAFLRIDVPVQGGYFNVCFFPFKTGVQVPNPLKKGEKNLINIKWDHDAVDGRLIVEQNGFPAFSWKGEWRKVCEGLDNPIGPPTVRLISNRNSGFTFHSVKLRTKNGVIAIDDHRSRATELPESVRRLPLPGILPDPPSKKGQARWQIVRRDASPLAGVLWSRSGEEVASEDLSGLLRVYDANDLTLKEMLRGRNTSARSFVSNRTGTQFVKVETPSSFIVSPLESESAIKRVGGKIGPVALAADHERFAGRSVDSASSVSVADRNGIQTLELDSEVTAFAWHPSRTELLIWCKGDSFCLSDELKRSLFRKDGGEIHLAIWSPDGTTLAGADSVTGSILCWNHRGERTSQIQVGDQRVRSMSFSPDQELLAVSYSNASKVSVLNLTTGKEEAVIGEGRSALRGMLWTGPNTLATLDSSGGLRLWNVKTQKPLSIRNGVMGLISRPGRPENPWLIIGRPYSGATLESFQGDESTFLEGLSGLEVASDRISVPESADRVSVQFNDGVVRTWDIKSGKLLRLLVLLPNNQHCALDPSGAVLFKSEHAERELMCVVEQDDGSLSTSSFVECSHLSSSD